MMKCIKALVSARDCEKQIGNHFMERTSRKLLSLMKDHEEQYTEIYCTRVFTYHGHIICAVDDVNQLVYLTHAGWFTSSTNRALNDYRTHFVSLGYENVWHTKIYAYEK